LREIASQNFQKANYVKIKLTEIPGYEILNKKPTYNEFIVKCPDVDALTHECKQLNLLPPLCLSKYFPNLKNIVLVCVTEMNSRESIEKFINAAKNALHNKKEGKK
jgi:glycine dehydrogenase subunit 1